MLMKDYHTHSCHSSARDFGSRLAVLSAASQRGPLPLPHNGCSGTLGALRSRVQSLAIGPTTSVSMRDQRALLSFLTIA